MLIDTRQNLKKKGQKSPKNSQRNKIKKSTPTSKSISMHNKPDSEKKGRNRGGYQRNKIKQMIKRDISSGIRVHYL